MSTVTIAILWTLNGQPMPPIVAPVDLPFGESTTYDAPAAGLPSDNGSEWPWMSLSAATH